MSGHSKFSNIKHRKGQQDAKRSKTFLQLTKQIVNALHQGGADPATNAALKLCLQKARQANMPKANINKIINKFEQHQSTAFLELRFGGFLRGGVAIIVECLTDNRNRTTAQIKNYLHRFNVNLDVGNCERLFVRQRVMRFVLPSGVAADQLEEAILVTNGIENYKHQHVNWTITYQPQFAAQIVSMLKTVGVSDGITTHSTWTARQTVIATAETLTQLQKLLVLLEQDGDVHTVHHNALIPAADNTE